MTAHFPRKSTVVRSAPCVIPELAAAGAFNVSPEQVAARFSSSTVVKEQSRRALVPAVVAPGAAGERLMSSLEIAKLTAKQHKNVMRDIQHMLEGLGEDQLRFERIYRDALNREKPCYELPKNLTLGLCAGYSVTLRMRIVDRWMELEQQDMLRQQPVTPMAIPGTMIEALRLAADEMEKRQQLEVQLEEAAPALEFYEEFVSAGGNETTRDLSKSLNVPERRFIKILEDDGVLIRPGPKRDLPPHSVSECPAAR